MAAFFEEHGLKRDTGQAVVETMQTQSDKFSRPGQNERKYEARSFGALVYDNMTKWRWTILNALHVAGAVLWSPYCDISLQAQDSVASDRRFLAPAMQLTVNTSTFPENSQSNR